MQMINAVYENGVFRPLSPVSLKEREFVTLSVQGQGDDLIAHEFLAQHARHPVPRASLEEVRQMLSRIPRTAAELVDQEREER